MRRLLIVFCIVLVHVAVSGGETGTKKDDHIYRSGHDGVTAPLPLRTPHTEPPKLSPSESRKKGKERTEVLWLSGYVGKDGKFHAARVMQSTNHEFEKYALKMVEEWEFSPCKRKGVPVNCTMALEITFHPH
ncbi:MAG TPA: energy transducer TonB [Terriglobales bacterium]|nr:energy transducer TonB [Terriglobales bacterium]